MINVNGSVLFVSRFGGFLNFGACFGVVLEIDGLCGFGIEKALNFT